MDNVRAEQYCNNWNAEEIARLKKEVSELRLNWETSHKTAGLFKAQRDAALDEARTIRIASDSVIERVSFAIAKAYAQGWMEFKDVDYTADAWAKTHQESFSFQAVEALIPNQP